MSIRWTPQHVATLAPDAASLKAGEKLSQARQWLTLGQADHILWGEIKGSGKNPYQTAIDLAEPAFKCSCPSRKFPCKHGLGLALIFAADPTPFATNEPLAWVQEWLEKRGQRAQKKAEKVAAAETPVDEATLQKRATAQQKRGSAREDKVTAGIAELQRWLFDLVRQGLAHSDDAQWSRMAQRMVDAQASGLARRLQNAGSLRYQGGVWQERLLAELARLHLLLAAWQRRDALPANLRADLYAHIGFPTNKDELQALPTVTDVWQIMGQATEDDGQMRTQRTWLYAQSCQRYALLLDFAMYNQTLPLRPPVGNGMSASVVYYPSATPLRAMLHEASDIIPTATQPAPAQSIAANLAAYTSALAANPWLGLYPFLLAAVIPVCHDAQWWLVDAQHHSLPLRISDDQAWILLGQSGGHPLTVFGEWNGLHLQVLTAFRNGEVL